MALSGGSLRGLVDLKGNENHSSATIAEQYLTNNREDWKVEENLAPIPCVIQHTCLKNCTCRRFSDGKMASKIQQSISTHDDNPRLSVQKKSLIQQAATIATVGCLMAYLMDPRIDAAAHDSGIQLSLTENRVLTE
ncbi:hypothetical protein BBP40_010950 [Aspergillus hancockii]|nr:hypothetical protein BBP40_010950 [Aspergillus hancockii]